MSRTLLKIALPILFIALAIAAFTSLKASKPATPAKPVSEKIWTVNTVDASPGRYAPRITLYGRIESPRSAELSTTLTAFVQSLDIDEGTSVRQGQTLLQLDPRDVRLQVAQRKADLASSEAKVAAELNRYQADRNALTIQTTLLELSNRAVTRFKALKGRNVASDTQLEDAERTYQQQSLALNNLRRDIDDHPNRLAQLKAQRQQSQAQLDIALLDLDRTRVQAPFDGRIANVMVAPGDLVRSGSVLLRLYNTEALIVRAQIPSRYLAQIRAALLADAPILATSKLDGQHLSLTLLRLSGEVGDGRAGIDALLRFNNPSNDLALGRGLELELDLLPIDAVVAVPPQALYGTDRIYRVSNERLEGILVQRLGETHIDGQRRLLLRSPDIRPGDKLVTTQLPNAITGLKVNVGAL